MSEHGTRLAGRRGAGVLIAVMVMAALGACANKGDKAAEPGPDIAAADPKAVQAGLLRQRAARLDELVGGLPAASDEQDRRVIAQALEESAGAVAVLAGDAPSGTQSQRIRTVRAVAAGLQQALPARIEPSINTAVQALADALSDVHTQRFARNAELTEKVTLLQRQAADLDRLRGPLHRLVVAQSLDSVSRAIAQMANLIEPPPADEPAPAAPAGQSQ